MVVALPGPPRELTAMVEESVVDLLQRNFRLSTLHPLTATSFLIPESTLEEGFLALISDPMKWSTRAERERIVFSLYGGSPEEKEQCYREITARFGSICIRREEVYAHELLFSALRSKQWQLVTAESCTGGLIAKLITDIPGSSTVFWGAFVAYANSAKETLLDVTSLHDKGAVSLETVAQMAEGALRRSGADIAIAVSGIAGPEGGSADKPVGTVYIGLDCAHAEPQAWKLSLSGSRDRIRSKSARCALLLAEAYIQKRAVDNDPLWDYI